MIPRLAQQWPARVRGGRSRAERPTEPTHVFRLTNGAEAHHRRCLSGVMQASSLERFAHAERRLSGQRRAQRGSDRHAMTRAGAERAGVE